MATTKFLAGTPTFLTPHKGLHKITKVASLSGSAGGQRSQTVEVAVSGRRPLLNYGLLASTITFLTRVELAGADSLVTTSDLCTQECLEQLKGSEMQTTSSGLQYIDIKPGKGPTPPVGFQVVVNYVAMTEQGKVFASSFEKGTPFDLRVGTGDILPGLDEGLLGMRTGGVRRLFIPASLALTKPLPAAPGRARVEPNKPLVFDVALLYIPGVDADDE